MFDLPKLDRLLSPEDFEPWVGRPFILATDPEPVSIRLVRLDRGAVHKFAYRAPFTLIFRSSLDVFLVDGIYSMRCENFGPYDVFLAPMLSPPGQRLYGAVFN